MRRRSMQVHPARALPSGAWLLPPQVAVERGFVNQSGEKQVTSLFKAFACGSNKADRPEAPSVALPSLGLLALSFAAGPAFAQANGNGSLQLCPTVADGSGSGKMLGVGSTAPATLSCSKGAASFALNNNGNDSGGNGFANSTAQVVGYSDGRLVLKGNGGVSIVGAANFDSIASFGNNRVTGVKAAELSASSTDAVNGAQLASTNAAVATNAVALSAQTARTASLGAGLATALGGGASVDPVSGAVTAPSYSVAGTSVSSVGEAVTKLDAHATQNASSITTIDGRLEDLASGKSGLVQQHAPGAPLMVGSAIDGDRVDFVGTAGVRTLTGVAAGKVVADSTEAVNGSQLAATNSNVAANFASLSQQTARATSLGEGVAAALGGGASVDPSTGAVSGPAYSLEGKPVASVGAALTNLDGRTISNTSNIANLSGRLDGLTIGSAGLVRQASSGASLTVGAGTDGDRVDFVGTGGARTLTGVAAGKVAADSADAINGAQLAATKADVAANAASLTSQAARTTSIADGLATALGGDASVDPVSGVVTVPSYTLEGKAFSSVGAALTNLDGRTSSNTSSITTINGRLDGLASGAAGLVQQVSAGSVLTIGAGTDGDRVNFAGTAGARTLSGVAAGSVATDSVDAVNGAQLAATNAELAAHVASLISQATRTTNIADGIAAALGAGASVDPATGAVTAPSYVMEGRAVSSVGAALTNLDGRTSSNTSSITTINGRLDGLASGAAGLVQQASPGAALTVGAATDGARVDFVGTAGARTLTGVAAGKIAADSADAVNGAQLAATNVEVAANAASLSSQAARTVNIADGIAAVLGGGASVDPATGAVTAPGYMVEGKAVSSVGAALTNLDGRTTDNTASITTINGRLDGLATGTSGLVQQASPGAALTVGAATDGDRVDFGGTSGRRTLAGLAAGRVGADSDEAVNGAQLAATNADVAANLAAIGVQSGRTTRLGEGMAAALGGGARVDPVTGAVTAPSYIVDGKGVSSVGEALANLDGRTTINTASINTINGRLNGLASGTSGLVQQISPGSVLTMGANTGGDRVDFTGTAGTRVLTGVAAGQIATDSKDAVNGAQLAETNVRMRDAEHALGEMDGRLVSAESSVTHLVDAVSNLSSGGVGLVTQADPGDSIKVGAGRMGNEVDFSGAEGDRRLTGVANGVKDQDVVTMAQLRAAGAIDPVSGNPLTVLTYDDVSLGRATFGGWGGTVLANVGRGLIAADSMEAVNGGQLFDIKTLLEGRIDGLSGRVEAVEHAVADGLGSGPAGEGDGLIHGDGQDSMAVGEGASASGTNSVAIGKGSVAEGENEVSVGSSGAERRVSNVAAGVAPTDAVNLQQMREVVQAERDWASQRFREVDRRIDRMGAMSAAYAGMALNTAGLAGDNRLGAGVGSQNGRSALAIGYQRIVGEKKNISVSLGGAFSGSDRGVSGGAGFSW
ncbi:YadA-like family protein [Pseudoxanthomonas winnipegensis]|nr:YadA-like family protein [Pseudoxanthomonas winnipegensis]